MFYLNVIDILNKLRTLCVRTCFHISFAILLLHDITFIDLKNEQKG